MKESDMATGRQLLKEEFVQKNPEWVKVRWRGDGATITTTGLVE